tara:strand:- start:1559 stop:2815 length:1257 start_codon:yes stop_codon:yes gene_type:complete
MNILVIGQGGREHAIAWKLQKSEKVTQVFVAPGNGGTELEARCTNVDISSDDFPMIKSFIEENSIELVVVGPEDPLVNGIKDYLSDSNVLVFGPDAKGAQLEGSKIYSKEFLFENNIPTGKAAFFSSSNKALAHLEKSNFPIVLKADGLAAGKGVLVANELEEAKNWVNEVMEGSKFGVAGKNIIIEECLFGTELSFMGILTPDFFIPFETSIDYKPLHEGNKGLNTGGMGCMSPSPFMNKDLKNNILETVVKPTISGLKNKGINYYGFMYFGLMVKDNISKVLEFNCRLGDPETQCLMMQMESDLLDAILQALNGEEPKITWKTGSTMGVVIASGGYPNSYKNKVPISIGTLKNGKLFHAGTKSMDDKLVTNGGRVFSLNYSSDSIDDCKRYIYDNIGEVNFDGMTFRTDIGEIYES